MNVRLLHEYSFAPLLSLLVEVSPARRSTKGTSPLFSYQGCPEKSPLTFHNHVVSLSRSPPLVPGPNILAPLEVFFKGSNFSLLPFFHNKLLTPASVSHQTSFTVSFCTSSIIWYVVFLCQLHNADLSNLLQPIIAFQGVQAGRDSVRRSSPLSRCFSSGSSHLLPSR